ncbi:MAG: class I SAM-dependent methyltransferase [Thermoplasmata archaeon]|nr:class I SAM-dependent methyltransferase [Thermoplasmata archaeon]
MASWADGESYEVLMGRWSRLLAPRFVEWARLPAEGDVLDVGSGTGALSQAVADAGARRVQGVDPSEGYADHATALLSADYPQVAFQVGDAMDLGFSDGRFDAAVSGLVLNFVPDAGRAVREMRRVVRPGGVVGAYVWDYAKGMELLRRFWDAAVALDPEAAALDEGNRFSICDPNALNRVFQEAELQDVEVDHLDQPIAFRDFDDYWKPFLGGQGPSGGYAMGLNEADRARFREALRASLTVEEDGTLPMTLRAWTARGVAP